MDIINLLPDAIANQIAAGEVIQRPSSVVKELLENSVDAGATKIQLSIKSAGKQLIQVIDNGKGMSENDARMAFERHATSKISKAEDLFSLNTMGFRGEALASIAAISQVQVRTKRDEDELGVTINIEDSTLLSKNHEVTPVGTQIEVKNIFFNTPARRKFLKKDTTEFKHIVDEFIRVSLAFPDIHFQLYNEGKLLHNFESGNKQNRLISILGKNWDSKLIPITEETDYVRISGYVGKPDKATKSRANQYFIVNNRYIKSPYLHHAIQRAFEGLIEPETHPAYAIYITLDPDHVDVNVHPTKQEIKFEDERVIYSFLHSSVKHALGKYSIQPGLDFSVDTRFDELDAFRRVSSPTSRSHLKNTTIFQTFQNKDEAHRIHRSEKIQDWQQVVDFKMASSDITRSLPDDAELSLDFAQNDTDNNEKNTSIGHAFQLGDEYIVSTLKSELMLLRKRPAYHRIIYERLKASISDTPASQNLIVPLKFSTSPEEDAILSNTIEDFLLLGFDIREFGSMEYVIHAVPYGISPSTADDIILDALRIAEDTGQLNLDPAHRLCNAVAKTMSMKSGSRLSASEVESLISDLFRLPEPTYSPDGKKIFEMIKPENFDIFFK